MGWQWHQLDHMQIICTSLQTDNDYITSPLIFYRLDAFLAQNSNPLNTTQFSRNTISLSTTYCSFNVNYTGFFLQNMHLCFSDMTVLILSV